MKNLEPFLPDLFKNNQPFYLYLETELQQSAQTVRKFWNLISQEKFKLFYSVKANPNKSVLKASEPYVDGFDVSSLAEARLLLSLGVSAKRLTWSGPAKTNLAIAELIAKDIGIIHIDSFDEFQAIAAEEEKQQKKIKKSLRVQLDGNNSKKLGISKLELEKIKKLNLEQIHGVHCYLGRESFSSENLARFIEMARNFKTDLNLNHEVELFLGPGLPSRPLIESELLNDPWTRLSGQPLNLECGRALTQSAGYYATRVLAIKESADNIRVIIDGGLQHTASHLKSPRYQTKGLEVQFWNSSQKLLAGKRKASIHGSLSLWYDTLMEDVLIPHNLKRGDWIIFNQCGAYGFSAACNQFIGPTALKEWMVTTNNQLIDVSPSKMAPYQKTSDVI